MWRFVIDLDLDVQINLDIVMSRSVFWICFID